MKRFTIALALMLVAAMLAGCAGTAVVYYNDCTCPEGTHDAQIQEDPAPQATDAVPAVPVEITGALKTGLAIVANASGSTNATEETAGQIKYDITFAAVLVDENGVIIDCAIDSVAPTVKFGMDGVVDVSTVGSVLSKNDLGEAYGMKAAGSKYEWNEQAAALCEYAVGKTVEDLKAGAIGESGKIADADLASKASIYIGGYVAAIEEAVKNASVSGAQAGDKLSLAVSASFGKATDASADANGLVQLDCDAAVITVNGDVITSCVIDSVQAKVNFDASGVLAEMGQILTKGQLGEAYGMKASGSKYEWNEQIALFCDYAVGKTADQVKDMVIIEGTADADAVSSVSIYIGGYQALIAKAAALIPAGGLKTGLAVIASASGSTNATEEAAGQIQYDITVAAVLVDENGVIVDCAIDSIAPTVKFGNDGVIDAATVASVLSKNELGEAYGMKAAGSKYEWNEQAAALCEYAVGKTVDELKAGAISESGGIADADLASKASIYIGGYVAAIEEAVKNAVSCGAQPGDRLSLAVSASYGKAEDATAEANGLVQLDCDFAVVTLNGDVITSCVIDSLQAKVGFDASGVLAEMGQMLTKGQLGEAYGMKASGSKYEWNEQIALFCEYVTGKTAAQVVEMAISEGSSDADIMASVSIYIGGYQGLVQKAAQ